MGEWDLDVSSNGVDFRTVGLVVVQEDFSVLSISPRFGFPKGFTNVTLGGTGFNPILTYACVLMIFG